MTSGKVVSIGHEGRACRYPYPIHPIEKGLAIGYEGVLLVRRRVEITITLTSSSKEI